jgi:hypothetical protein
VAGDLSGRIVALAVLTLCAGGCYRYVTVPLNATPDGADVRALLDPENRVQIRDMIGRDEPLLRGRLVRREAGQVFLRVRVSSVQEGALISPILQEVPISTSGILQLEQRSLSRSRTGLLVTGFGIGTALFLNMILDHYRSGVLPPDEGTDDIRIPLLRAPLGFGR